MLRRETARATVGHIYDGKTEHQGHGEEGCEAHHLTEYSALSHNGVLGSGVSSLNHDGLGYLPDSVGDKR